jgi:hypothetical protein
MSSSLSPPGSSNRAEILEVLREWLIEANEVAFHEGGTYASVLGRALDNLTKEGDAKPDAGP